MAELSFWLLISRLGPQGPGLHNQALQFLTWGLLGSGRLPQCTSSFCARVFTTVVGLGPYGFLFIEGLIQGMWGSQSMLDSVTVLLKISISADSITSRTFTQTRMCLSQTYPSFG